jgi:hypothetical protein
MEVNNMINKKDKKIVWLLLVGALVMTVGFATYTQNLPFSGDVLVKASNWDVQFMADKCEVSSGSVPATTKSVTATDWNYAATLSKPGDYFEATVTVQNAGTLKAKLTKLTMSTLTAAEAKYLTYTVTYNGVDYTSTTEDLEIALDPDATANLKVRAEYVKPASSADLPSTATTVTLSGSLDFALNE